MPAFYDPEGCPVTITFEPEFLSRMITVNGETLIFKPTEQIDEGDFEITVFLNDPPGLKANATFTLTVYQMPKLLKSLPKRLDLQASKLGYYSLPVQLDVDDQYVIHDGSLPRFVTFNYPNYEFFPNSTSDLGLFRIGG